jgi:hypothetical protein
LEASNVDPNLALKPGVIALIISGPAQRSVTNVLRECHLALVTLSLTPRPASMVNTAAVEIVLTPEDVAV